MNSGTSAKTYKLNQKDFVHVLMAILEGGASKSIRYVYRQKKDLAPYAQVKATRVKGTGDIRISYKHLRDDERQRIARLNKKSIERKTKK